MHILVIGGTRSFGQHYISRLLQKKDFSRLIVYSRDEMKQWEMQSKISDPRVRFFIGDVRDKDRLNRALNGVTHVVHAAATKIVPTAEYNPFEAVKTNVIGATNVIDSAIDNGVHKVVALSTDKASSPINLYGATKLVSDKLFIAANHYSGHGGTKFGVVRYGNVMASRGSLIPFLLNLPETQKVPLTDRRMTRFMITLDQGIDLVETAFEQMQGGEVFVKKIPSMKVTEIIETVLPNREVEETGIRPGEKLHEQMIGPEDDRFTFDFDDHYRIYPAATFGMERYQHHGGKPVEPGFSYTSDQNSEWMTREQLLDWLNRSRES
jgi:UDP-N-acetylglucosamine 4,6-dehydratase (inverting)